MNLSDTIHQPTFATPAGGYLMTSRHRFSQTMSFGTPDRVPWLEEGLRDDVLDRWRQQVLPAAADLASLFHYDRRERIELDLSPRPPLTAWPPTWQDLSRLRQSLDSADPVRLPADWSQRVAAWRDRQHILELPLHQGLFLTLGIHDWSSFEQALFLLEDDPDLVREVMDLHAQFIAAMADRVLGEVEVDFVSFSEPIGSTHGSLVSPARYRQVALASYRPILDVLQHHRVPTITFVTYANAAELLPDLLEAGFNCLWAIEVESPEMDYRILRRRFGRDLRLIGGIDLDCLLAGPQAIEREMLDKVPSLLAQGGYIPLADGRVRTNVSLASYRYYRRLLEQLTGGREQGCRAAGG